MRELKLFLYGYFWKPFFLWKQMNNTILIFFYFFAIMEFSKILILNVFRCLVLNCQILKCLIPK